MGGREGGGRRCRVDGEQALNEIERLKRAHAQEMDNAEEAVNEDQDDLVRDDALIAIILFPSLSSILSSNLFFIFSLIFFLISYRQIGRTNFFCMCEDFLGDLGTPKTLYYRIIIAVREVKLSQM